MTDHHPTKRRFSDANTGYAPAGNPRAVWSYADDADSLELQRIRQRKRRANLHRFPFFSTDTMIFLGVTIAVILFTAGLCYSVIATLNASPVVHEQVLAG